MSSRRNVTPLAAYIRLKIIHDTSPEQIACASPRPMASTGWMIFVSAMLAAWFLAISLLFGGPTTY